MNVNAGNVDITSLSLDSPILRPYQHGAVQGIPIKGLLSICSTEGVGVEVEQPKSSALITIEQIKISLTFFICIPI
jgi:hypothetical protein